MDTAICTFDTPAAAENARARLTEAGFDSHDLHIVSSGHPTDVTRGEDLRHQGGREHEIALSTDVVERVAGFFGRLFGADHPHAGTYAGHVDSGRTVLLLDAHAPGDVARARVVLEGERAGHYDVVDRTGGQRLRDVVRGDPTNMEPTGMQTGTAMPGHDTSWDKSTVTRETHAVATGDGDLDNVGLRYADKGEADKPTITRDGLGRTRNDD